MEPLNGQVNVGCVYGRGDDHIRFRFFCDAAQEFMTQQRWEPDIIHAHDWSSAPVTFNIRSPKTASVFTIHNLEFGQDLIAQAMRACTKATTVSQTYREEIGGHHAVAPHLSKFYGVRNGIDTDIWDPTNDEYLPQTYDVADLAEGKAAARAELRSRLGTRTTRMS